VKRQNDMLGDHFTRGVQERAAGVLRLANDGRITGSEKRVLHLLDDASETRLDDLQGYWINGRHWTA
jgi:hypothetical protein